MRAALLLLFLIRPLAAPAPCPGDPVEALAAWLVRFEAGRVEWNGRAEERLVELAGDARTLALEDPAREAEVDSVLLDLAGLGLASPLVAGGLAPPAPGLGGTPAQRAGEVGARVLREVARGPGGGARLDRVLREVLLVPSSQPVARRRAALSLVAAFRPPQGPMALLAIASDPRDPLRPAALWTATDWPDPRLDRLLVAGLARPHDPAQEPHPFTLVARRLARGGAPLDATAAAELEERARALLVDRDWRQASRGIELVRALPPERVAPPLVAALATWQGRAGAGRGSRRIEHELVSALQGLSGKSIGAYPDRWWTWWRAVQEGQVELAPGGPGATVDRSTATFFGLRPVSDRVTFVIDRSGSMRTRFGTTEHARYEEAVSQLVSFLEASGTDTRFNVLLFGSDAILSSRSLVPAVPGEIGRARRSLLSREPEGGTELRRAIDLALALGPDGRPDLERLEADTVIVLCDGRTARGVGWVPGFLAGPAAEARVVFHCVLLASAGDGTLEALAEGTGGDFVRVGG